MAEAAPLSGVDTTTESSTKLPKEPVNALVLPILYPGIKEILASLESADPTVNYSLHLPALLRWGLSTADDITLIPPETLYTFTQISPSIILKIYTACQKELEQLNAQELQRIIEDLTLDDIPTHASRPRLDSEGDDIMSGSDSEEEIDELYSSE